MCFRVLQKRKETESKATELTGVAAERFKPRKSDYAPALNHSGVCYLANAVVELKSTEEGDTDGWAHELACTFVAKDPRWEW